MQLNPGNHVIVKQGYLKKLPNAAKIGASLKRANRRWFVFGLTRSQEPYLESYDNEDGLSTGTAHKTVTLGNCQLITKSLHLKGYNNVFTLTLGDRQLSLIASTLLLMDDWCHTLDTTLRALGILQVAQNIYVEAPQGAPTPAQLERRVSTSSQRDPTSPLPPPPPRLTIPQPDQSILHQAALPAEDTSPVIDNRMNEARVPGTGGETAREIYEPVWDRTSTPAFTTQRHTGGEESSAAGASPPPEIPPRRNRQQRRGVTRHSSHQLNMAVSNALPVSPQPASNNTSNQSMTGAQNTAGQRQQTPLEASQSNNYVSPQQVAQPLAPPSYQQSEYSAGFSSPPSWQPSASHLASPTSPLTQTHPLSPQTPIVGATGYSSPSVLDRQSSLPSTPLGVLPPKMMEALGISGRPEDDAVFGWNIPPPDNQDAPPPYMPRNVLNRGSQLTLKQNQVELLQKEMGHAGGMKVILRKVDCHHMVAWAEGYGGTWIAGWNQKSSPFLHNAFHIGDQIISINGQVVENARMAHKLIKHSDDSAKITFILKRIPNAKVFALKRTEDGQSLGIRREGGTGEITEVEPYGLGANHGIPSKAPTMDATSLCNWFITEINMRPINLFFKDSEIEKRLNAVGKDISILIQPIDFITELKRQLKLLKNYKDFIVQ